MRTPRVKPRTELKNTAYEIFIGVLSILSIVNLVLVYAMHGDGALQQILSVMNALFSVIFLGDFVYRMATAPSAGRYFLRGYGWADLLASLPFPQLKILRIFRLLRVYRLMRDVGPRTIWNTLIHDRANSTLMTLLLLGVLVFQFGSISILAVEGHAKGANITSASDALWYTIVTISTVGYGDQFPVTNAGRALGVLIIIVGVGIFGTFTGYLANLFLGPSPTSSPDVAATTPIADSSAAASGVAAGAASGAVAAGVASSAADQGAPATAQLGDRLAELLAQSERTTAELRRLVADAAPGPAAD
ncbi:ion transporter [Agromyces sp. CCNWLW203]|uniref:ion transporter n=1 Tax=Agromyces sp. CCNWLW203 TaxID=3112842 RepID=UPI002F962E97